MWVPITALARPSSCWASATFSLVASAWKSTKTIGCALERLLHERVGDQKGARRRRHEEGALQVDHADLATVRSRSDQKSTTRHARRREVCRSKHALELVVETLASLLAKRVVAGRDHIGTGVQQPAGESGGQPDAVCRVLAVDDAELDAQLLANRWEVLLERPTSGGAEDIGEKEESQGSATLAAGTTSM